MPEPNEIERMAWRGKAIGEANAIHDMRVALANIEQQQKSVLAMIAAATQIRDLAASKAGVTLVEIEAEVARMRHSVAAAQSQRDGVGVPTVKLVGTPNTLHAMIDQVLGEGGELTAPDIASRIDQKWQRKVSAKTVGTVLADMADRMKWERGARHGKFVIWRRSTKH